MTRNNHIDRLIREATECRAAENYNGAIDKLTEAQRLMEKERQDRFAKALDDMAKGEGQ